MSEDALPLAVRQAAATDLNYVFETYWKDYIQFAGPPRQSAQQRLRNRMSMLWHRAGILVAHFKDDPLVLLGWICAEAPALHYVYVKKRYRGQGIARSLVAAAGFAPHPQILATHWTPTAQAVAADHKFIRCVTLDAPFSIEVTDD